MSKLIFFKVKEDLTKARKRRDNLREEFGRLKCSSGLLTRNKLLRDFERSIAEGKRFQKSLSVVKKAMEEKFKQESEITNLLLNKEKESSLEKLQPKAPVKKEKKKVSYIPEN